VKLAPSEVSRDNVQVELRDNRSISPDCSAVNRFLAFNGKNLTLVGSPKIAAASARQTSTSIPVQLPLSSGIEKPARPSLTPQETIPRSLTVFRVSADAAWEVRPAARARVTARDTRFMGKAFRGIVLGTCNCRSTCRRGLPGNPDAAKGEKSPKRSICRSKPLNMQRLNSSAASQNDWRAGSRG